LAGILAFEITVIPHHKGRLFFFIEDQDHGNDQRQGADGNPDARKDESE
jgi:hypothetical protein